MPPSRKRAGGQPRRVALMLELDWPYARHLGVFAGTQRFAQERGWECVVDEAADETLAAPGAKPSYDGVIARATLPLAAVARRRGVPVVNTWFDSPAIELPRVAPDFAAVGHLAAEHLLGLGLRRFACVVVRGFRAQAEVLAAFRASLGRLARECRVVAAPAAYARSALLRRRFHQSLATHIESWQSPIGVFVMPGDLTARHLASEAARLGRRIPDDVAIVAGINEPMLCLHPSPSLTSVDVSYEEIGYRAAKLLDALMDGRAAQTQITVPPLGIVARQSTNFLAVDDELVRAALQHLTASCHRQLSVTQLAAAVHASRRTLERRFRAALGRSVAQELRRLRVERAKRQLLDTTLPVKAVARSCGYANEQRLSEALRRAEGISPTKLRALSPFALRK